MPRRKTTEEFIQDAIRVHGNRYIYSKVDYINSNIKVEIICLEHGSWQCRPGDHINKKSGCPECGRISKTNKTRKSLEQFIAEARFVHGDKYDYSKVIYINTHTKIIITCLDHDDFEQKPDNHLSGHGCPKCAGNIKRTTDIFVTEAKKIHGDDYDYSKVEYKNNKKKVIIICKIHGEFKQIPDSHLHGYGCKQCTDEGRRYNTAHFIARSTEIHGDKFDYSLSKYVSHDTPVTIICNDCDFTFDRTPHNHYRAKGCPRCRYKTQDEFIAEAFDVHGDLYDYSKVKYTRRTDKVEIICKIHKSFLQLPSAHIRGSGCPKCLHKTETLLLEALEIGFSDIEYQYKARWCKRVNRLPFDIALVALKIIIELDGPQHFKQVWNWPSQEDQQQNDAFKTKAANEHGFSVIRLLQTDVKNNTYDWMQELLDNIKKICDDGEVQNIFMCKKREYEPLKELLLQE